MREEAQLDLRVVGAQNTSPFSRRDEAPCGFAPELRAHRDVLQVRVELETGGRSVVTVWLKSTWMRPSSRDDLRQAVEYVDLSLASSR
jgi:hypothetical protein